MKTPYTRLAIIAPLLFAVGCDTAKDIGEGLYGVAKAPGLMWDGLKEDVEGKFSSDSDDNTVVVMPQDEVEDQPEVVVVTTTQSNAVVERDDIELAMQLAAAAQADQLARQAAAEQAADDARVTAAQAEEAARLMAIAEEARLQAQREAEAAAWREQRAQEEAARQAEADRIQAARDAEAQANDDEFVTEGEENPYPTFVDYNENEHNARPGWADSYLYEDRCYISSTFDHNADVDVDTPYGRMRVSQVHDLIGHGPGIQHAEAVYNDVQCGHGPANDAGDEDIGRCPGRVDQGAAGCGTRGPKWTFPAQ